VQEVSRQLQVTQTLAVLEVVHAATGLVRSPVFTTMQQVASRLFVVWGILFAAPRATTEGSLALLQCAPLSPHLL
jgi:very-long-chain (3R)-3-hydroxyacyl-CoA dehydratase